ncbi:hypothetical protein SAMN05421833_108209 [Microbispora rosea]|uniref:Uncharacterized protein n=1 Tax=Microbispora rosea TaxID=58117 RepID=A0A1N7AIH8_9ACTN|nr:hypothetical protein [Microbispora rosea]GIH51929.1 hypothetical protein Mro03_71080 [Microbispora rosea subsp. rosea]SIR38814.1 hypothetical protein SAMN05421833_108209 [Microbispora rosea]
MTITAIETRYAGCRFRSRLEARWAVFFDHQGIRWEYEPKGFMTAAGPYLPDFRIPDYRLIIEVKGADPTPRALDRCAEVARACQKHGGDMIILGGDIPVPLASVAFDTPTAWTLQEDEWVTSPLHEAWAWCTGDHYWSTSRGCDPYCDALTAARSARFEYGESGAGS